MKKIKASCHDALFATVRKFEVINFALNEVPAIMEMLGLTKEQWAIGGSVAGMLYGIDFGRCPHDIDIIVKTTSISTHSAILSAHTALMGTVASYNPSCEKYSYIVGIIYIEGISHPINVILDNSSDYFIRERVGKVQLQHPTMIKYAKMSYKPQRMKDIKDIEAIIEWEHK